MRLINLIPLKEMENPCWKGYEMVGTKKKDGREVPNCVPVKEVADDAAINQPAGFFGDDGDNNNIDEYDVVNEQDMVDFFKFIREYKKQLSEATCDCLLEGEYQGRDVPLGKPMAGDVKKFKVYVKNPAGKVVKVNFGHGGTSAAAKGEKTMRIRKSNPKARKSFRARHNCANPGPRTKARYWSCRKW
jgi:hypothetical protein